MIYKYTMERDGQTLFYGTSPDEAPTQDRYGSIDRWRYTALMAWAILKRVPRLKVAFRTDAKYFEASVLPDLGEFWSPLNDPIWLRRQNETNMTVPYPDGVILFPTVRGGLDCAAELTWHCSSEPWCRLFVDEDSRASLISGEVSGADFEKKIRENWMIGLWSDYTGLYIEEGPYFSIDLYKFVDEAIDDVNALVR